MGKKKSDIVSDMMRGTQIVKTLSDALRDMGGSDQDLLKILDPQSPYPVLIGEMLMEKVAKPVPLPQPVDTPAPASDVPDGWRIMRDVDLTQFSVDNLECYNFLHEGQLFIHGVDAVELAKEWGANLGLADATYVLRHCDWLPDNYREYTILFPGTVLLDHDSEPRVPYLAYMGGKWVLDFYWVNGEGWGGYFRLARLKRA
jgi:hypothetical protein